jgi:hypothetical protein
MLKLDNFKWKKKHFSHSLLLAVAGVDKSFFTSTFAYKHKITDEISGRKKLQTMPASIKEANDDDVDK